MTERPAHTGQTLAPAFAGSTDRRSPFFLLADAFLAERERWVLWVPVGLGAGIGLYFSLPVEPSLWLGASLAVVALGLVALARGRPARTVAAVAGLTVATGFLAAELRSAGVAAPVLERAIARASVTGRVAEIAARDDGQRLVLEEVRIAGLAPEATPARVRVSLRRAAPGLAPGDWVRLRAGLEPPPWPAAPGAFDFARAAWFARIGAVGFVRGPVERIAPPAGSATKTLRNVFNALRFAVSARLRAGINGDSGAIAAALLTGDRGAISQETLAAMRNAGLAHLLAISGLHLGLVATILFLALRAALALAEPIALRYPIKKWAAFAALCGTFFYLFLAGATIPTQRAFLMSGLVVLAVLCDRTGAGMRTIAWTATVVLLVQPESLLGPSFQMSFAAVTALVAAYEGFGRAPFVERSRDRPLVRIGLYFAGIAAVTLIAGVATAPFAIYHFNRIAAYGLAANLIAVPITAMWIMPLGLAALALMPFGAEGLALAPMGLGIDAIIAIARTVAAWPNAVRLVPAMPAAALGLAAAGGLWLCLWRGRWRWAGLVPLAVALATPLFTPRPDILIDARGKLFAVRDRDGALALSSAKTARFAAAMWLRRDGRDQAAAWPEKGKGKGKGESLRCDGLGCIYRAKGHVVALVRDGRAAAEDCRIADVVIASVRLPRPCPAARIAIDARTLYCRGAQAIYLDGGAGGRPRVETVADRRGLRPWSQPRGRRCREATSSPRLLSERTTPSPSAAAEKSGLARDMLRLRPGPRPESRFALNTAGSDRRGGPGP